MIFAVKNTELYKQSVSLSLWLQGPARSETRMPELGLIMFEYCSRCTDCLDCLDHKLFGSHLRDASRRS